MEKKRRRRVKQEFPLRERLTQFAQAARSRAGGLPAGPERDDLLGRAREAETSADLEVFLSSPLQPSK